MNQVLGINNPRPDNQEPLILEEAETRDDIHPPTLSEIQRQACKIHDERVVFVVSGGSTLADWLEAENE